jgi:hypothetical protein
VGTGVWGGDSLGTYGRGAGQARGHGTEGRACGAWRMGWGTWHVGIRVGGGGHGPSSLYYEIAFSPQKIFCSKGSSFLSLVMS